MKKIIILASALFILSCTQKNNCNADKALEDSVRIADSIAVIESTRAESEEVQTSKGYSNDPDYEPTISDKGKYHTIDGKANQVQYQGSAEQKRDIDMIDEYAKTHPDF